MTSTEKRVALAMVRVQLEIIGNKLGEVVDKLRELTTDKGFALGLDLHEHINMCNAHRRLGDELNYINEVAEEKRAALKEPT